MEGSPVSVMLSEGQIEADIQAQMDMLPDVMMGDHIITTNHGNINQFLSGTEWLDILGTLPTQPIIKLVKLPGIKIEKPRSTLGTTQPFLFLWRATLSHGCLIYICSTLYSTSGYILRKSMEVSCELQ